MSRRILWRKLDFLKEFFFSILSGYWSQSFSLLTEIARKVCQNCNLQVYWSFLERFIWENFIQWLHQFWTLTAIFRLFVKKFSAVLSNSILIVPRTFWVGRFFIERNLFCWITSENEQKILDFLSNFFHEVLKTAFYFCKRSFWGKLLFWKNQFRSPFRTLRWKFSGIWQLFLDSVTVIAFYVPIGALRGEKLYLKKLMSFPYLLWTLSEKLLVFYEKVLGGDVKTALYFSRGSFRVDFFFEKIVFVHRFRTMSGKTSAI